MFYKIKDKLINLDEIASIDVRDNSYMGQITLLITTKGASNPITIYYHEFLSGEDEERENQIIKLKEKFNKDYDFIENYLTKKNV